MHGRTSQNPEGHELEPTHFLCSIKRKIRRTRAIWRWVAAAMLPGLFRKGVSARTRLLLIYDFSSQPFSLGDILIFQEVSLVLRNTYGLGAVDIALVYDPARPAVADPAFAYVRPENFLFHLSSILPAAQVNPYLGSLLLFDSHRRMESYIADNMEDYYVWPSLSDYASREYLFYDCFNRLFADYYSKHGTLPSLSSRLAVSSWAQQFLELHAASVVPVSVQLRRNSATPKRNSDYESWIRFFRYCENRYPVKFIVLCSHSEIDPSMRELPNVVIAKDQHTSLEQDLALIEACSMHMGPSSGPGTIALFNSKPYCMFGFDVSLSLLKGFIEEEHRIRYFFSAREQYWIRQTETYGLLIQEFEHMWSSRKMDNKFEPALD